MKTDALWFTRPGKVEIRPQELPALAAGEALVRASCSAISSGTEMLFYRGQFSSETTLDANIPTLSGNAVYPLRYGYCMVGQVIEVGPGVDARWLGQRVFCFQPHQQHFIAPVEMLFPIPTDISDEQAVFFPNLETAANLVMDGGPLLGERVVVFGQGVVGLLTCFLLSRFPLAKLVTLDCYPQRRAASLAAGAAVCLDPAQSDALAAIHTALSGEADLTFEVSGAPTALNQAISVTGFGGRVVIGSWYGKKPLQLNLGAEFHRSRIRLLASQVSTIDPSLSGRWDKERRYHIVWDLLRQIQPERWISHRFAFQEASQAYALLDERPGEAIQVIVLYA